MLSVSASCFSAGRRGAGRGKSLNKFPLSPTATAASAGGCGGSRLRVLVGFFGFASSIFRLCSLMQLHTVGDESILRLRCLRVESLQ